MQTEIRQVQALLDKKGHIIQEGWARHPYWKYDRSMVKGGALAIKEWDYYAVINQQQGYAVTATISDLGYAALFALSYIDFNAAKVSQTDALAFFPRGSIGLAPSSTEDSQVSWANKNLRLAFIKRGRERHIMAACPTLELPDGSVGLDYDITLTEAEGAQSLNIATSWKENRKAFYLNEKINCLKATGTIRRGMETEQLLLGEAWGVLDWGRGRWTYQNTWYWASASGLLENIPFGLNLGYGFSDRSPASENAVIYNNCIHKLGEVVFSFDQDNFLNPWTVRDAEGRLNLVFDPLVDRSSKTNFLVIKSDQHQVFGYFSGTCILDDGTLLQLDRLSGFAEQVYNRW